MKSKLLTLVLLLLVSCMPYNHKVEIIKNGKQYELRRDGMKFFIKGVVGFTHLETMKDCGVNSVRISDNFDENLKRADSMGISALVSLPVKAERDGFDYSDETTVKQQREDILKLIRLIQFHSSVLIWAVGNELDYMPGVKPYYTSMWDAVDDIARQIKLIDPDHPVMTIIGTSHFDKVKEIVNRCPDLDLLGINAYGDMKDVPALLKKYGWNKPYVFTEWGVSGYWEVPKTGWKAPFEENSSVKADLYSNKYNSVILRDSDSCLGSYAFLWGEKQETTPTWFGLFDEKGNSSEAVNVLKKCWKGGAILNHAPHIDSLKIDEQPLFGNVYMTPAMTDTASVYADDPENDSLTINWLIRPEAVYAPYAGIGEKTPPAVPGCLLLNNRKIISFKAPETAGAYRMYVYLYDGKKHFATANIPFYVR